MNPQTQQSRLVLEAEATREYGTTVLKAARHRHFASRDVTATALADELGRRPEVEVLALLDEEGRPAGILTREGLFSLLGKPFGREVLGRTRAWELAESAPRMDCHASLFAAGTGKAAADSPYRVLVDAEGRFRAILSSRDLAEHLSRITEEDIDLAGRIQERLEAGNEALSNRLYGFEAWSRPAKGVGGDFWYSKRLEDGRAFFALCDVSGKGVAASLVVSLVWGTLRMFDFRRGLYALLRSLNEALVATFHLEKYLTGFFGVYDPRTGVLEAADMGHAHALVFREGRARRLDPGHRNLPVGVEPNLEPVLRRWRLRDGDALFVYSDGIPEQEDAEGGELGERRLAILVQKALRGGRALRDALPGALDLHRGTAPQQDDMSFILLTRPEGLRSPMPRAEEPDTRVFLRPEA
ncbi:MAG TPA: SpoIIE family protein phosphatase [Spirochaetia bacterium]|nr:SpoIIE family protein phosphatase [Spirochaetia bacterium]